MKKLIFVVFTFVFTLAKAQIVTEQITSQTIASKVPGYSQVTTVNTVTISYTPPTPPASPTPVDGDTTTEDNGLFDYATLLSSNITLANGNYTATTAGKVWTVRISIPNALNIGLIFTKFLLSPTAEMYIYNDARTVLKNKIKKADFTKSDTVSISSLNGNAIIVYIIEPGNTGTFQSNITIGNLFAGFEQFEEVGDTGGGGTTTLATGTMGTMDATINCIPHMQCYPAHLTNARAVARIGIPRGGTRVSFCTGTLINNDQNNGRAYLLTAFHCVDHNNNNVLEISEIQAMRRATYRFQFWRTICDGTVNNPFIEFNGAVLVASSRASDVVLLELFNSPGIGDGVNYAGWSRQTASPSNTLSYIIHHPRHQDMRHTQTRTVRTYPLNGNYWQAYYSSGVVDRGSSGSALFNENGQIVGQLKAGWSSCNYTNFSDRYGKFDRSWTGAGLDIWLSRVQGVQSTQTLVLSPLDIQGSSAITCNASSQYSVPNLLDATYEWIVSSNLRITSGLSTPTITVLNNGGSSTGTITVTIRTPSKGKIRFLTVNKTINTGVPVISISYSQSGSCNSGYQTWSLNASSPSSVTSWKWTVDDPSSGSWYIYSPNSASTLVDVKGGGGISITATNSCGTSRNGVTIYSNCPTMLVASPNPATDNVTISMAPSKHVAAGNKKALIYQIKVTDPSGILKKQFKYSSGIGNATINLRGLNKGVYVIQAFDGTTWSSVQVIKK